MPLNFKKVTTESTIQDIGRMIAFYKKNIADIKSLSKSGDKKLLLEWLHKGSAIIQKGINDNLGNPNHVRILRAVSFAGELRGIKKIIDLFENPDMTCFPDEQQMALWEQQLKAVKDLPTRKNE